jgi:hypothetical protein
VLPRPDHPRVSDALPLGALAGNDLVRGLGESDLLRGQRGADLLLGGAGGNRFDINPGDTGVGAGRRDVIGTFGYGADRIDLATIDARSGVAGDQAFTFLGTGPLTGAGQLRYGLVGTSTIVQASTDSDAAPELEIELSSRIALAAGDFVL